MKYFLDTEFIELGPSHPLELLSIGIVNEKGEELYLENVNAHLELAHDWVKQNVVPHLIRRPEVLRTTKGIAAEIRRFIPPRPEAGSELRGSWMPPEFWGYFGAYDWVIFCQLFGTMMDLPEGYPMFIMDLMQLARFLGIPREAFPPQAEKEHHALHDARWNKKLYDFMWAQLVPRAK